MGVSIQQYRAAIGLHQSRDNTNNNNSDNSYSFSSSTFSDYHNQSSVDDVPLNSPVKGSWKLHAATLIVITTLSIVLTCTPHACAKTLLVRAGVEVNPGPVSIEDQRAALAVLTDGFVNEDTKKVLEQYDPSKTKHQQIAAIGTLRVPVL